MPPANNDHKRKAGLVPILGWLPGYDRSWLAKDAVAAASVWALLVPQGVAYASIAGVPPIHGGISYRRRKRRLPIRKRLHSNGTIPSPRRRRIPDGSRLPVLGDRKPTIGQCH